MVLGEHYLVVEEEGDSSLSETVLFGWVWRVPGAYMGKRYIKLDRPMTPRIVQQQQLSAEAVGADGKKAKLTRPAGCRTVFVKNLPYECEEKDVMDAFMVCGKIAKVSA